MSGKENLCINPEVEDVRRILGKAGEIVEQSRKNLSQVLKFTTTVASTIHSSETREKTFKKLTTIGNKLNNINL